MQWDDVQYFLAVARSGQLARAASSLGVDATTVGRRLRRLEQSLGQGLFEQTREGQMLTDAGERLLAKAETIERQFRDIEAQPGPGVSGTIRVSVSEGFGTWFVAHHLPAFAAAHPHLRIDLVASSGFLNPSRREADLAILLARPRKGPLYTRKLTDYGLRLYAARAYLDSHPPISGVADLRAHSLVGYVPDLLYAPELRYLSEIAPDLDPAIRSTSINAQYRLVAAGAGLAVLPCFIGDSDSSLARVLDPLGVLRSFWLVTHNDTRRLARVKAFTAWLTALTSARQAHLLGTGAELGLISAAPAHRGEGDKERP